VLEAGRTLGAADRRRSPRGAAPGGFTGGKAAKALGLGAKGDRTIRRWIGEDTPIPYAAWAICATTPAWADLERGLTPRKGFSG
jgi:hypothetical protein